MRIICFILLLTLSCIASAQGPYAGKLGSSSSIAIHADSSVIIDWASTAEINRGWVDIRDTSLGKVSVGEADFACGYAHEKGVVSLGDGGEIILQFNGKLYDGPGYDFAIFENSFTDDFLELAFVEVSSDGRNFVRFPSHSLTDTSQQVGGFGSLDPTNIHNLAGKYPMGYGTPFDLADLKDSSRIDLQNISHIKLIDVVGSVNPLYSHRDAAGRPINDPFPTPFPSGGFDLDGIGVMHIQSVGLDEMSNEQDPLIYPNPFHEELKLQNVQEYDGFEIYDLNGRLLKSGPLPSDGIMLSELQSGSYILRLSSTNKNYYNKRLIKR